MFTGLVAQKGEILAAGSRLLIKACFEALEPGESIAVNGVCLTLLPSTGKHLAFDLSPETLTLTTLGALKEGEQVNLERALLVNSRLGGHFVSGHVDTTARVIALNRLEEYVELRLGAFAMPSEAFLLPKGSITVDGVSLTINEVHAGEIKLMLIPHTQAITTLANLVVGQHVNIEFDYFTRILVHQLTLLGQLKNEVQV